MALLKQHSLKLPDLHLFVPFLYCDGTKRMALHVITGGLTSSRAEVTAAHRWHQWRHPCACLQHPCWVLIGNPGTGQQQHRSRGPQMPWWAWPYGCAVQGDRKAWDWLGPGGGHCGGKAQWAGWWAGAWAMDCYSQGLGVQQPLHSGHRLWRQYWRVLYQHTSDCFRLEKQVSREHHMGAGFKESPWPQTTVVGDSRSLWLLQGGSRGPEEARSRLLPGRSKSALKWLHM